jgi:L,D-peptidoglycan transpeptidase YkuD (ErfK/YbiS/YcfS/YnhG family)
VPTLSWTPMAWARAAVTVLAAGLLLLAGVVATPARAAAAVESNHLDGGQRLAGGQWLMSADRSHGLAFQADGNLVAYAPNMRPLWSSGTYGNPGAVLTMQADGNLVVQAAGGAVLWHAGTYGNPGAGITVQDDGNVVLRRTEGSVAWYTGWDRTGLDAGQGLSTGQQVTSANGRYQVVLQPDGNLVVYGPQGRPLFFSGSYGARRLSVQADGNLVATRADGAAAWHTGTWREGWSRLDMQDDGNLVLRRADGTPSWYSGWDSGQWAGGPGSGTQVPRGLPLQVDTGSSRQVVTVVAPSAGSTTAQLSAWQAGPNGWSRVAGPVRASLGSAGIGATSEYVARTPAGTFTLTEGFGLQGNPGTALPYRQVDQSDWWVSDVASPYYNQHVRCTPGTCPFDEAAGEDLGRAGWVYDHALVIDHNRWPARAGVGSAFFLHVSNGAPTAGCVAIDDGTLTAVMRWLDPRQRPLISIGVG